MSRAFTLRELRMLRALVSEEINNVRQWSTLPTPHDRGASEHRQNRLEELLGNIDENIKDLEHQ
jgi:hypothetical protein